MDVLVIILINFNFLIFLKSVNSRKKGRGVSINSFKLGVVDWIIFFVIFDIVMDVVFVKGIFVDVEIFLKNVFVIELFKFVRGILDVFVLFFLGRIFNKEEFVKLVLMDFFVGLIIVFGISFK